MRKLAAVFKQRHRRGRADAQGVRHGEPRFGAAMVTTGTKKSGTKQTVTFSVTAPKDGTYMLVYGPDNVWNATFQITATCTANCERIAAEGESCGGHVPVELFWRCEPQFDASRRTASSRTSPATAASARPSRSCSRTRPRTTATSSRCAARSSAAWRRCTKIACSTANPCCNTCFAALNLFDEGMDPANTEGVYLTENGANLSCSGNSCDPTPSPTPLILADPAEPNDVAAAAWPVSPGVQADFSLALGDADWFTFIAKAGMAYTCETITNQVDTVLTVHGSSGVIVTNDDRASGRLDSFASWTTASEQTVYIEVTSRGGGYGLYQHLCQIAIGQGSLPAGGGVQPMTQATATPALTPVPTGTLTGTLPLTATHTITLAVRYVGEANPVTPTPVTPVRLLIYYDANNDRQASVGEGIANVLVLATDKLGQVVMTVFTNLQGEAVFNVTDTTITRLVVPFVPGWSTQIRQGQANELTLGLPAVRLPVFWPVQNRVAEESR